MKININSIGITKALGAASLFSLLLLQARILISENLTYTFLSWNLFLAWLPFCFSVALAKTANERKIGSKAIIICILWLAFFPNAPYIITDLFHLKPRTGFPFWFDILMITSFVWNGLLLCFASLIKVQDVISKKWGTKQGWLIVIVSLILSGYGIYLGRFLRWNTWDILINPLSLLNDIIWGLLHPLSNMRMWGVTLTFSLFLITGYVTFLAFINRSKE